MNPRDLQNYIFGAIDRIEDATYFSRVLAQVDEVSLDNALLTLLRGNEVAVADACVFINDIVGDVTPTPDDDPNVVRFRQRFRGSVLQRELESLTLGDNFRNRVWAIDTLGKTQSSESLPALIRSLEHWRERDQFMVSTLIRNIWWLQGQNDFSQLDASLSSTRMLARWSVVDALQNADESEPPKRDYLKKLCDDESVCVRDEARYLLAQLDFELSFADLPENERDAAVAHVMSFQPKISFLDVHAAWWHDLEEREITSYTFDEAQTFVNRFIENAH